MIGISTQDIIDDYNILKLSLNEIAQKRGINRETARQRLQASGITLRTKSEAILSPAIFSVL